MLNRQTYYRPTLNFSIHQFKINKQTQADESTEHAHLLLRYQDQSYFIKTGGEDAEKQKHLKILYGLIKKFKSVRPQSTWLLYWNMMVMLIVLINFYEIPIAMFFTDAVYYAQFQSVAGITLNVFNISVLFANTLIVRPITSYYEQGRLISSRKFILKRYFQLEFWLNIISWVALFVYAVSNNPALVYLKLLFYLSAYSLEEINKLISYKLELWRIRFTLYKISRLLFFVFFIVLWLAGIFFTIDYHFYLNQEYYPVNLWLTNSVCSQDIDLNFIDLIQTYQWYVWLNYSVYWALQTISTLGYGDITPRNPISVIYSDIVIVVICIVYAFFVSEVWQIFFQLYQKQVSYKNKAVRYYERNYRLNRQMVSKLQNYLYKKEREKQKQQNELQINENLSDELKFQLVLARQKKQYISIPFFNHLSFYFQEYAELLNRLASRTLEARYGQSQLIFTQNSLSISLHLLSVGEVELHYPNSKIRTVLKDHNNNNRVFFGVINFLERSRSSYQARALKFSKITELREQDFLNTIKSNQKIKQKYQQLVQQLKMNNRIELCGEKCWICSETEHHTNKCPKIFRQIEQYKVLELKFEQQERKSLNYRQYYMRSKKNTKSRQHINMRSESRDLYNLVDKLIERNANEVDQVRSFFVYRLNFNL